ncbi:hypothetical protein [Spiroplasma endosymbiont of Seladonia tumulorum]|uniref:hypothetical protein n=1 Tax=Spiroplasma endosymbiont of Seladonia tumulorum TaxID=3066321 RepID=UPI0030CC56E3
MLYGNLIILFIEKYQNLNTIQIKEKNEDWDPLKPYYIDLFLWVFETKEQDLLIDDQSEGKIERIFWNEDKGRNFKAVYRWNGGGEPLKPLIDSSTGKIIDWNLKQQINVNNNKDNEIKVSVKNKDISENPIYRLEANFFNWLSITNELETNNIPSLIPAEIKLSDGEYGKYLTNLIVSNDKIENYLNYFSEWYKLLYSKIDWISTIEDLIDYSIKITFDKKLFNLNQIEISGIWGYGNYEITIFTEKEQININNLQLFNKNNEKLSLIILEI